MKIKKKLDTIFSGLSASFVIALLAFLTLETSAGVWLMFSFGATVFLVFVLYELETAQPANIFFGHLVSIFVGVVFNEFFGLSYISLGASVGVAVIIMTHFKIMHPPAASNPIVAISMDLSFDFILFPVVVGSLVIILLGIVLNRFILKRKYPKKFPNLIKKLTN